MTRTIVTAPDPILRQRSEDVADPSAEAVRKLLTDLKETCVAADGIGLAAPQIGVAQRVVVIRLRGHPPYGLVNPEVIWASKGTSALDEGCLSIPNVIVRVTRPTKVRVRALDEGGKQLELRAEDLHAKVIQHEIDHLNGVLITDYQQSVEQQTSARRFRFAA